jgi:hypothetical protein
MSLAVLAACRAEKLGLPLIYLFIIAVFEACSAGVPTRALTGEATSGAGGDTRAFTTGEATSGAGGDTRATSLDAAGDRSTAVL